MIATTLKQVQVWQTESSRRDLPQLVALAEDLIELVRGVFTPPIKHRETDHTADLMALALTTKQSEHLRSMLILIQSGAFRDSQTIARSMLETRQILLWAFVDAPTRTDQWFWHGAILDRMQMNKNKAEGIEVDQADEALLQPYIDQHGPNYYKSRVLARIEAAQEAGGEYELPPEPWDKSSWSKINVADMFDQLKELSLYNSFYRRASEWAHSGSRATMGAVDDQRRIAGRWGPDEFKTDDVQAGSWSLGIACESMLQSLALLDHHFSLGYRDRLDDTYDKLLEIFNGGLATAQ